MQNIVSLMIFFWVIIGCPPLIFGQTFSGKLVKVLDADTVEVLHNQRAERIRLAEIDTPEKGQPFGNAAKRYVLDRAAGKAVTVYVETEDKYGRTVGEVILPNGQSLNRELVREGYAWWYRKYSDDPTLGDLERQAREARRGLWADPNAVAPWDWRRGIRKAVLPKRMDLNPRCGTKRFCREMNNCQEAKFFLEECGVTSLDGDKDGIPCETLCQ